MSNLGRLLAAVALMMVALAAARLWCVKGLLRRITIEGPSMAPALCGAHYDVTCQDCRFPFRIDADDPPANGSATCPNCGYGENPLAIAVLARPDRVVADRWPFLWREPHRGDIAAAHAPLEAGELIVKRVAAVSQGAVSLEDGDLFVNGEIIRKTLPGLHAVRALVHDNDYQPRPAAKLPPRWRGEGAASRWAAAGSVLRLPASATTNIDWLEYQHWPCTANPQLRGTLAPVRDNDSYNQGPGARELNAVSDVLLSCQVRCSGAGELAFAVHDGDQSFQVFVATGKGPRVVIGGQQSPANVDSIDILRRHGTAIEFGVCDRQLLFAVDDRIVVCVPYNRSVGPRETLHPLSLGARGLEVEISHLRVWRDTYLLDPQGLSRPWQAAAPLQRDELFLLGDNPPVSVDSRQWEPQRVLERTVLGKVYRPFWASQ